MRLNEEINKMRKTMGLGEASSKYTVDITPEELIGRVPFLKHFKNFSSPTKLEFQNVTYNENVMLYNKDGEAIPFKQFNLSSEFNYSIVDMYDGRHRFMVSLKHETWLMPPNTKEPEQELFYRVMTMAMTKQMESLSYSYDEVLEQETLTKEQWNEIINKLNESFFKLENYLDKVLPVDLAPHLDEDDSIDEARSSDYLSWKRKNVTIRGAKEVGEENNAGAMLGRGLYTAFLSNKDLAKQYGKVYFVLGAMPKNPKVFNSLNEWEIWFYNTLVYKYSKEKGSEYPDKRDFNANTTIEDAMQKLGYDGIVIKGREMVNFKPEDNIKYFSNEDQLENYYETVIKEPLNEEEEQKEKKRIALLFIVIDNKVLLFKRSPEETTNANKYGMLGGHIEKGESPEAALRREIKEEAGVELGSFKKLKTYELDDVQLNVFYTNEFDTENIKLDKKEHTGKKFFTLEQLDEMSPEECIDTNKGIARDYNKKAKEDKQLNETVERMKSIISF
jgi:8-oxo-dGTP pyrophosphatase MutT (NUDIX family)